MPEKVLKKALKASEKSGSTTLEYAIILPVVFAVVLAAIMVFLLLYQKALVQNLAEAAAESLSRQWSYTEITAGEISTGVYKRETYDEREIYWNIGFWDNGRKEDFAEEYIKEKVTGMGVLKAGNRSGPEVRVEYRAGIPAVLTVKIKGTYRMPGAGLMKTIGLSDALTIEGAAEAFVFDSKDIINTADYAFQILQQTKTYQKFTEKISPLRENIEKFFE